MRIGILGAGSVGGNLGLLWSKRGHEIFYGVRDRESARTKAALEATGVKAQAGTVGEAATFASVIVVATPWRATESVIQAAGDLSGKILIDCINPLKPDLSGLSIEANTSASELIAKLAPGARVVKAFNTIGAGNLLDVRFDDQAATMPICGDDAKAKEVVGELVTAIGFDLVDAGPLVNARLLESLALLWIHLAVKQGYGSQIAFKMLQR